MFLNFPSTLDDDAGREWSEFCIRTSEMVFVRIGLDDVKINDIWGDFAWNGYKQE